MKYQITEPTTLFETLKSQYPDSSHSTVRKLLKNKRVMVGRAVIVKANHQLVIGDEITILTTPIKTSLELSILHQDKDLVVINKPKGLLSVPLDKGESTHALGILRKHSESNNVFVVHRIDRETSGVMIFARTEESKCYLWEMFKKHDFRRVYVAVVQGYVKEDSGTWKSRLMELSNLNVVKTNDPEKGKESITHFKVIRRVKDLTYLQLTLETGKKHQIRVHCKDAGHPILGDKRYGDYREDVKRLMLHAYQLEFIHPFTKQNMSFTAPIPGVFQKFVGNF